VAKVSNPLRKRHRVAFVLAGGGNLGALQVGQLRALSERGITPDLIVGCSAGAMNGVGYAIDPGPVGVARLEEVWDALARQPDLVLPGSWIPNPVQLLRKGPAIVSADNMRSRLEMFLGPVRTFEELAVHFECVATDVDSNSEAWFHSGELLDAIMASAALPSVFPMVTIEGRRYLDGGVLNNVPINRAIELGATRIYVLHMGQHGKPSHTVKRPVDAAMIAYWIARNGRFARDLATLPPHVEAFVLPPGERPDLKYDDFSQTAALIEQGYVNAVEFFAHQDRHREETTTVRAERLRRETRRVIDELRDKVPSLRSARGSQGYAELVDPDAAHDNDVAHDDGDPDRGDVASAP